MDLSGMTVVAALIGLLVGALVTSTAAAVAARRRGGAAQAEIDRLTATIADLRQDQVDARENNRMLRHELAVSTPEHLQLTRDELAEAGGEIERLKAELADSAERLAARGRSLRQARLAIQEIREQLEAGGIEIASADAAEVIELDADLDDGVAVVDVVPDVDESAAG